MGKLKHQGEDKHPEIRKREERQKKADALLDLAIDYWESLLAGKYRDATHSDRIRATENLANRFGLPIRTDVGLPIRLKVKTVEMRGFMENGVLVTPEVPTEDEPADG